MLFYNFKNKKEKIVKFTIEMKDNENEMVKKNFMRNMESLPLLMQNFSLFLSLSFTFLLQFYAIIYSMIESK